MESGVCCRDRAALQQQQGSKGRRFRAGLAASFLCSAAPGALRVLLAVSFPPAFPLFCPAPPPLPEQQRGECRHFASFAFQAAALKPVAGEAAGAGALGPRCSSPACPPLPFPFRRRTGTGQENGEAGRGWGG